MRAVIIGLSAAGLSCLDTLVRFSPDTRITVVSEEKYSPYCRCLLTHYLGGGLQEKQMVIRDISHYPPNVHFIFGERAEYMDTDKRSVLLSGGREIRYDRLLIATGAHALKPQYYDETKKTFTLRSLADAKRLEPHIKERAAVLGGGFVGIKAACGLLERGIEVDLIVSSPYPLSMVLDEETARFVERDLEEMGIGIRTHDDIAGIGMRKDTVRISLRSGIELESDVVVVGKGVRPSVGLAKKSGIKIDMGITVDEFLMTSAEGVYAAGDCCETIDIVRKVPWINAIWPVAVEQGYFAALNMAGSCAPYPGSMGMNSLKTRAFHLISGGVLRNDGEGATFFTKYIPHKNQFRKLAVRDNIPVGMAFYNSPEDAGTVINLIKKGVPLTVAPEKIVEGEAGIMDILRTLQIMRR